MESRFSLAQRLNEARYSGYVRPDVGDGKVWDYQHKMKTLIFQVLETDLLKAAVTFARNVCVIITGGHPLKIAQQRNRWVYYMYTFPMR